jgi:hypothetical protein
MKVGKVIPNRKTPGEKNRTIFTQAEFWLNAAAGRFISA